MKWLCSLGIAALAVSTVGAAQSRELMNKPGMDEGMGTSETYVGCIEAGSAAGSFVLTHAARESMHDAAMPNDTMKNDSSSIALTGPSVSKKHLGHKVSVTGLVTMAPKDAMGHQMSTLAVKAVKVVAR